MNKTLLLFVIIYLSLLNGYSVVHANQISPPILSKGPLAFTGGALGVENYDPITPHCGLFRSDLINGGQYPDDETSFLNSYCYAGEIASGISLGFDDLGYGCFSTPATYTISQSNVGSGWWSPGSAILLFSGSESYQDNSSYTYSQSVEFKLVSKGPCEYDPEDGVILTNIVTFYLCPNDHQAELDLNGIARCINDDPDDPDKETGSNCNKVGNPCDPATGNKYQSEVDISKGLLRFIRSYNSTTPSDVGLGKGWRSNYHQQLSIFGDNLLLISGQGRGEPWLKQSGIWYGDADSDFIITQDTTGFVVTLKDGATEQFDNNGQLVFKTDTNGNQTTYAYNASNQLINVSHHYGSRLDFTYDANNHITSVVDQTGVAYQYQYDTNDNLSSVIYPDTTPIDDSDNPRRTYHYENPDFPNHLTGITDENGDRYATYAYDTLGRAISTEHAQTTNSTTQERFELDFQE